MTVLPLLATLTALMSGPLFYVIARRRPAFLAFLDGFVLVSIAGLVLLEVLPGAYGDGGAWSLAFVALGALGPSLIERTLHEARREAHLATLALAVLGLLLHSVGDGVALAPGTGEAHHGHEALGIAVVVHSVPVGLVVWWVMAPVFGRGLPAITLALMCAATVAGYVFGAQLSAVLGTSAFAWFQALVAGSILHVVFGRPHLEEDSEHRESPAPFEGLGNLFALAGLAALDRLDPHADGLHAFFERFWSLGLRLAPLLLLGYLLLGPLVSRLRLEKGRPWSQALPQDMVEGLDRGAALVLLLLAALSLPLSLAMQLNAAMVALLIGLIEWLHVPQILPPVCAALLCGLFLVSLLRCGGRRWVARLFGAESVHQH